MRDSISRPNLHLDHAYLGRMRRSRGVKMQGQRFLEIIQRFVFRCPLTGNVDFEALGDVPIALPPNSRCKRSLHAPMLSHRRK